jgi:hypothetical protein
MVMGLVGLEPRITVLTRASSKVAVSQLSRLRVAAVRSKKLVAEAGDSSGTQRKGNVCRWKPLPSNG